MSTLTPMQLAAELRISEDTLLAFLKRYFSVQPESARSVAVSEEHALAARGRYSSGRTELPWLLAPGETRRRREIHGFYGGQEQGGISTPSGSRDILIFTDPDAGREFGYDRFEGLREDGSYAYTGEGQRGDQAFRGGNKALRDSAVNGLVIRLFRTHGIYATYVGSFTTSVPTYHLETIPDQEGNPRTGIIFNLIPLEARTELLPAFGGELNAIDSLQWGPPQPLSWFPPEYSDIVVPGEEGVTREDRVVSRVEFELQRSFGEWMEKQGDPPSRLRLRAGATVIEPDFYFRSRGWIVEAKRSSARGFVREAIGQVLDYVNVAERSGLAAGPAILLPGKPEADLRSLMTRHGIVLATRDADSFSFAIPD